MVDPSESTTTTIAAAGTAKPDAAEGIQQKKELIYVRVKRQKSTWIIPIDLSDSLQTLHEQLLLALNPSKTENFKYQPHPSTEAEGFIVPAGVDKVRLYIVSAAAGKQQSQPLSPLEASVGSLNVVNDCNLALSLQSADGKWEPVCITPFPTVNNSS